MANSGSDPATCCPGAPMRFKLLVSTLVSVGFALAAPAAHALLLTGSAVGFSSSTSLVDAEGGGATTYSGSLGTTGLAQFDASLGVLTGATLRLASTRKQTLQVTSTAGDASNNANVTSTGQASSSIALVRPTGNTAVASMSLTASCTGNRRAACNGVAAGTSDAANAAVAIPQAALDLYVGGGTIAIGRSVSATVTQGAGVFGGTETTSYRLDWAGSLALDYSYLLHAAPSFEGGAAVTELTLDFGTVTVGDAVVRNFSLFNLVGDRVGLDLDSMVGSGDTGVLGVSLGLFDGLEAGNGSDWSALLDTSTVGAYGASYTLFFSDADVGAASTRQSRQMTLNLLASVIAPRIETVPEPGSLPLLLGSLGMLLAVSRRRRA
ncbi:MAG: choice-of-anchor E domain-containing protein [Candidatus Accumulibacter sp.]|nr:choice-of-anchor E domain-containing protein [Accumulibacter sp.]